MSIRSLGSTILYKENVPFEAEITVSDLVKGELYYKVVCGEEFLGEMSVRINEQMRQVEILSLEKKAENVKRVGTRLLNCAFLESMRFEGSIILMANNCRSPFFYWSFGFRPDEDLNDRPNERAEMKKVYKAACSRKEYARHKYNFTHMHLPPKKVEKWKAKILADVDSVPAMLREGVAP